MESLGTAALVFASLSAAFAAACGFSAARGNVRLLPPARAALHAATLLLVGALAALTYAFLAHDFSLRYVVEYSDRTTSFAYLLCGLWGGQEGSLLVWAAFVAAAASALTLRRSRGDRAGGDEADGRLVALMAVAIGVFVAIILLYSNPFAPMMRSSPVDGVGLNGLLRNPLMVLHPPVLFAGYACTLVPAALALDALIRRDGSRRWIAEGRPFAMAGWLLMTVGNALGMLWAYEELGWGGYWAWDPVENASFLPWIVLTAYMHAASAAERRGVLQRTVAALAFASFALPVFGTYLTRSGVVSSVHSFSGSPASTALLWMLALFAGTGFVTLVLRRKAFAGAPGFEALLSREAGVAATVLVLLLVTAAVTAATMAPVLSELFTGDRVVIDADGYATFGAPLGALALFLTAVCPLLAFRRTSPKAFARAVAVPGAAALLTLLAHVALGSSVGLPVERRDGGLALFAMAVFPMGVFVIAAAAADVVGGIRVRVRERREKPLVACGRFLAAGRRRVGGDLIHVGIAMAMIGFAGASYKQELTAALAVSDPAAPATYGPSSAELAGYRVTYLGSKLVSADQYEETLLLVRVDTPDGSSTLATPSLREYRTGSMRQTAEVAILDGVREDFYIEPRDALRPMRAADGTIAYRVGVLRVFLNPLTWFVWAGSTALAVGALVAAWPSARKGTKRGPGRRPGPAALGAAAAVAIVPLVGFAYGTSSAALVAAGAAFAAALAAGGIAVHAGLRPPVPSDGRGGGAGPADEAAAKLPDRVAVEIDVERSMGRWEVEK